MTIDATNVQINYFYDYDMLVLHVILIVDVCTHIYNYSSHICDYNVDITKWSFKCNYNLCLLHVWMEKYNQSAFFIQYWMDIWMDENLVAFVISHSVLAIGAQ
jgi:hypothetical protein